jgi:HSP20 family molecular chaperone IbpA
MLNTLIKLLENDSLMEKASKLLNDNFLNFENVFGANSFSNINNTFTEVDGKYEMRVAVGNDATEDNVTIDLHGSVLYVKYQKSTDKQVRMFKIVETLPIDADLDTLDASIADGVLTIKVDKLSTDGE